jgi:hypothetical protein
VWSTTVAAPIRSNGTRFIYCRTSMPCSQWLNPDSRLKSAGARDARTEPFRRFSFLEHAAGICEEMAAKRGNGKGETEKPRITQISPIFQTGVHRGSAVNGEKIRAIWDVHWRHFQGGYSLDIS